MKLRYSISGILVLITLAGIYFTSCVKGDPDVPPIIVPKFVMPSTDTLFSIAQLKALHNMNSTSMDTIKRNIVIQGIVTTNDSSGNVYKFMNIQDTSAGITINIENKTLYTLYKPGQRVYVKCKGLILGSQVITNSGTHVVGTQLGMATGGGITTIPDASRGTYLFKDSLPGKVPEPKSFDAFGQFVNNNKYLGMLVKVNKVKFTSATAAGVPYNSGSTNPTTNTTMQDTTGATLSAYVTQYATWATTNLPLGKGNVVGIFSYYGSSGQLVIRDLRDVYNFAQ
jgi:hypothetical protein